MQNNLIEARILAFEDPVLGNFISKKMLKKIEINPNFIEIIFEFGFPILHFKENFIQEMTAWLSEYTASLKITVLSNITSHAARVGFKSNPEIKNIIAIASGKGGVGKSTVAVNLAFALKQMGAEVGLLDADIYGPSQPLMLGTKGEKARQIDGKLQPIESYGLQTMSIGYLVEQHAPLAWRGPMLGKALEQLLNDTAWRGLDYLIIDLPPGTGDIQLTLCQKVAVNGAVLVTTPQDLALLDVRRAVEMFVKLNVPILGIVENMSEHICENCGVTAKIFGDGGGANLAREYQLGLLGKIPLKMLIREMTDNGNPLELQNHEKIFFEIALKIANALTTQSKDYSAKFPNIVVQQNHQKG